MRTVILIGLLYIGDSLGGSSYLHDPSWIRFVGWVILACMIMDIVDFFRDRK